MNQLILIVVDLAAIAGLSALYFVRHRRRDLVVAYVVVNVGVLAVAGILGTSGVGLGLGLGLFGVLSIIRLRSKELQQHEVAYYFAALAMGLVAGLGGLEAASDLWVNLGLIALVGGATAVVDSRALLRRCRQQIVRIDGAYTDETVLRDALERHLGGRVHRANVLRLDLIRGTTTVDVRYQVAAVPLGSRWEPTGAPRVERVSGVPAPAAAAVPVARAAVEERGVR